MQLEELSIEVTNECTLSCIHCSSGSTPKKLNNELTLDELISLVAQAKRMDATVLSLSGGNPLLTNNTMRLIDFAVEKGYERVLIYTTGHSHDGVTIRSWIPVYRIMAYKQVTWIFSLHSHVAETNNYIMNSPDAYGNIVSSIAWLVSKRQSVEVHMVPMKPNYTHINGVRELCHVLGVKQLSLLRFVPQTRGKLNNDKLGMSVDEFACMQRRIVNELKHGISSVPMRLGCPIDFRHAIGELDEKAKPCHAGDDLMLVRPNGDVHPCAAWKSLASDSNVRESDLDDIWENSATFRAIRSFKEAGYKYVDGCMSCPFIHSCKTGCPAQRLHAHGELLNDLYCEYSDPLCPLGI